MNSLSSQYKALFREELKPLGFILYKKTFYRVINDVVQTLMLRKTSTNFSIDFSILPLCLPVKDLYCEGYDISILGKRVWWQCWDGVEENAFTETIFLFRKYVMPIFEHGVDAKSAYDELIKLEKMIYTGVPGGVIHKYSFVLMCIKANNYDKAKQHLAPIIMKWDEAFQLRLAEREKKGDTSEHDLACDRFMLEYQELKEEWRRLCIPDVDYFQKLMAQNEAISLEYLAHPRYPGQRK